MTEDFNKLRKRGLIILGINLILALLSLLYKTDNLTIKIIIWGYLALSIILFFNRLFKTKPRDNKSIENDKYYIFGKKLGEKMNKTSLKFQYEAQMMGYVMILSSLLFYVFYTIFFQEATWYWKAFYLFNSLAGIIIIGSNLTSTIQQYIQYMSIFNIQKEVQNAKEKI